MHDLHYQSQHGHVTTERVALTLKLRAQLYSRRMLTKRSLVTFASNHGVDSVLRHDALVGGASIYRSHTCSDDDDKTVLR
eukprot:SAG11_NODE_126_length_15729_cov_9.966859_5_plen_80_part_00